MEADMIELLSSATDMHSGQEDATCELLNITNAAVQALDKSLEEPVNTEGRVVYADASRVPPDTSDIHNIHNLSKSSLSSQTTSASDILIKSTVIEKEDEQDVSHCSKASSNRSSIFTGDAKPVRISLKKLKEIKSPFDAEEISTVSCSSSRGSDVISEPNVPKTSSKNNSKENTANNSVNSWKEKKAESTPRTVADSGYATHKGTSEQDVRSQKSVPDGTLEGVITLHEDSIIDVVAKNKDEISNGSMDSQPEIVTVQESIVTVRGTDVNREEGCNSSISSLSLNGEPVVKPMSLQERFEKFQPAFLHQGSLATSNSTPLDRTMDDVVISHVNQDTRKSLRDKFSKRQPNVVAVKKIVQPKLHSTNTRKQKLLEREKMKAEDGRDPVTTAAVAAASAVAATQPFLKAQHEMESKMALVLDRLAKTQGAPIQDQGAKVRISELEAQVAELTRQRLNAIEFTQQQQQLQWQAQLSSVPRQNKSKDEYSRKAVSLESSRGMSTLEEEKRSIFDTPAPRPKPPKPTKVSTTRPGKRSPEAKKKKGAGFLAEILASEGDASLGPSFSESPASQISRSSSRRSPTRSQSPRSPRSPQRGILRTPPKPRTPRSSSLSPSRDAGLRRAGDLVRDLDELKTHMKEAVTDLNSWNRRSSPIRQERTAIQKTSEPVVVRDPSAPAPLDGYLRETEPVEVSSPYPRVKISGNAPLIDKYADIMQVLKSTKKHQVNLEQNFDAIQHARQESHVYGIIEEMAQDRSAAERMRIKQMVDDHIHSMNRHLEKDVMSELQKAEDRMKNDFMIPERDISVPKTKSKFNRNVQSRINTGLKKPLNQKSAVAGKENVPVKARQKPVTASAIRDMLSQEQKPAKIPSNVPRLSQPAFVPKRSSQKEPYLRFRSSSPKSKSGSPVSVTRSRAPSPPMPTAILLSAPLIRASHSPVPLTTSTPVQKTKPKSPSPKKSPRAETPPLISQPAETDRVISPQILNDSCIGDNEKSKEPVYSDDFDESVVESSAPIDIPGYTAPKSTYHGPQFPPKKRSACSDEIAVEIRRKELAENEAVNWIEQELMARMISDHLSSQAPPPSSLPPAKQHLIHDDSSLEEDASVIDESLITDAVGQKGLQLFIDAGVAIDSGMVNALMREVILEKIASTLGQITSDDAALPPPPTAQPRRQPLPPPGLPSAPTFAPIRVHSPPVIVRGTPVPTPEVTPHHSPILPSSPVPQARPHHAPPTPDRTPTPSAMEEINEVRYVDDFEEPDEILIPKPVKLTPDADAIWDMASPPSHEVMTPARSLSPVTSSPPPVVLNDTRTPSPSVQSEVHIILPPPLPEPEVVVQKEDRATSPQAWSEPDADLPAPPAPPCESAESPPPAQSSDDAQEIPQDDEAPKRVATISESSSATSGALSVISDTLNEPFSEGQWMLSAYSEGELPHPPIENEIRNRIRHHLISDGLMHQQSVDDTLQDTDEIHQDQISSTDISQSEGEILHRDPLPNIQSTLAAMAHSQSAQIAAQSAEKSIGEVILPSTSTSEPQKSNVKKAYRMLSAGELSGVPEEPTPSDHGPSTSVTRSTRRHPTLGQVVSTSDEHRPLRRRNSPQASRGSLGLSQSQTFGHSDMAASQHSMRQTASDVDSATTDRLNIEAILQNRDYFNTTQSDLATTTDFQLRASTDQRMAQTAEYSLMDSEVMSADESSAPSLGIHVRPPLQVSVTIPSVLDEDSDISPEEISEISLH